MSKLDDFETWLRATGTPDDVAAFSPSIIAGFIAVAGKGQVTAEHVATSLALARDAKIEVAAMERIGALLVKFEAGEVEPAAPVPAAVAISIRIPKSSGVLAPVAVAPEERSDAAAPDAKPADVKLTPTRPRRPIAAIAIAVLAIGGVGVWWIARGDDTTNPDAATATAPAPKRREPIARLAALDLPATFPEGWVLVAGHGRAKTAHVVHGAPADLDDEAYIALLPIGAGLAAGAKITAPALVAVAHDAEQGAAAQLLAKDARYYSEGCETAGPGLAVCRGAATRDGEVVALQTYVRVGAKRAVLAIFMAKPTMLEPAKVSAAIVDSFAI